MRSYRCLLTILLFLISQNVLSQEINILPNGILNPRDEAVVTGDYVRIRKDPSLNGKIITKVNVNTEVLIIERDKDIVSVSDKKNYWYNIKVKENGIEGWMFGAFLKKKEEKKLISINKTMLSKKLSNDKPLNKNMTLKELGTIKEARSIIVTGDLNSNGSPEVIFLNVENKKGYGFLTGYEHSNKSFKKVYTTRIRSSKVDNIKIFDNNFKDYEIDRDRLRLVYKFQSPIVTLGKLDGKNEWVVWLRRNRYIDNDGTTTFYINISQFTFKGGRVSLKNTTIYNKPLPIKKMIAFDINSDGRDDIICEIGGKDKGGGIVVLSFSNNKIKRTLNTGINTYNDIMFTNMWGINIKKSPTFVLYTSDPSKRNEIDNSFGFLYTKIQGNLLKVDKFFPVNNILDDINNNRVILKITENKFIVIDYDKKKQIYSIKYL